MPLPAHIGLDRGHQCREGGDRLAHRAVSHPHGFNLGVNQGEVGGAGIAAHLHQHVVPRWTGDANFMPIIGKTKPVPQLLGAQRDMLAEAWLTAPTALDPST